MASTSTATPMSPHSLRPSTISWRPTKMMNMRDLSKDDDFLSHLLVEKLGAGEVPLLVHKMDPSRRLPKVRADALLDLVRRLVTFKGPTQTAVRQAVDELLRLQAVLYYLRPYTQRQINAFATHASRYLELYCPGGSIEIAHTSRYSHRTGKSELCILATRPMAVGMVITELKGSMANLTDEEDKELQRTDRRNTDGGIRRDFSVIHSRQMKKSHLFLGPARFVNHDCDHNAELFREGRYITFRVIKPIIIGQEITAHYGESYFGRKNRHCLCETCEKNNRGGYKVRPVDEEHRSDDEEDLNSDVRSEISSVASASDEELNAQPLLNVNERRTRRGVYAVMEDASDDSDDEGSATPKPAPAGLGLLTPSDECSEPPPEPLPRKSPSLSSLSSVGTPDDPAAQPKFQSVIVTRAQKARAASQLMTPPRSDVSRAQTSDSVSQVSGSLDVADGESVSASPRKRGRPPKREQSNQDRILRPRASLPSYLRPHPEPSPSSGVQRQESKHELSRDLPKKRGRPSLASKIEEYVKAKQAGATDLPVVFKRPRGRPSKAAKAAEEAQLAAAIEAAAKSKATPKPALVVPLPEPVIPRDEHGRPLPTCVTCRNVLPVISVNDVVVWGLSFGSDAGKGGKGKKKDVLQDCPRCMRHLAIFGHAWPARLATQLPASSQFMPTPREEGTPVDSITRKVTPKGLPALDKKLAAAAAASQGSRKRRRDESEEPQPRKKARNVSCPPTPRVKVSVTARKVLSKELSRTGRKRMPSIKVQASVTTQVTNRAKPPIRVFVANAQANDMPRKRGRPRKLRLPTPGKDEEILEGERQPREINGRFGKKKKTNGIHARRRGPGRMRTRNMLPDDEDSESESDDDMETVKEEEIFEDLPDDVEDSDVSDAPVEEQPAKRTHAFEDGYLSDMPVEEQPAKRPRAFPAAARNVDHDNLGRRAPSPIPRRFAPFKPVGGLLYRTPNPTLFARAAWVPARVPPRADKHAAAEDLQAEADDPEVQIIDVPPAALESSVSQVRVRRPVLPKHDNAEGPETQRAIRTDGEPYPSRRGSATDSQHEIKTLIVGKRLNFSYPGPAKIGSLTYKPSPMNFAKRLRQWTSVTDEDEPQNDSVVDDDEDRATVEQSSSSWHPYLAKRPIRTGFLSGNPLFARASERASVSDTRDGEATPGTVSFLRQAALFTDDKEGMAPKFVDAGWDSSEASSIEGSPRLPSTQAK